MMPDSLDISETRRIPLEKHLQGGLVGTSQETDTTEQHLEGSSVPLISENTTSDLVPIIPLQIKGSKRPFFYMHSHVEGGAFYCFTLARRAGADQPFYVLDPCRFDGLPTPPTLESIAAAYIRAIRTIQPEGPYFLGGFCGGALIAFEAAQQLRAAGQEIAFLALIEARDGPAPHRMHFRRSLRSFARRIGNLVRLSQERHFNWYLFLEVNYIYLHFVYDYFRVHFRRLQNTLGLGTAEHVGHGRVGDKRGVKFPKPRDFGINGKYIGEPSEEWIGKLVWAFSNYTARRYPGKVTYIWASDTIEQEQLHPRKIRNDQMTEAEEFETHIITSDHTTLRNKHIHDFAECLHTCLSKAQEATLSERMSTTP